MRGPQAGGMSGGGDANQPWINLRDDASWPGSSHTGAWSPKETERVRIPQGQPMFLAAMFIPSQAVVLMWAELAPPDGRRKLH